MRTISPRNHHSNDGHRVNQASRRDPALRTFYTSACRQPRPAQKAFDALDGAIFERIARACAVWKTTPTRGAIKMQGPEDYWRIRVGDWRIIYSIFDRELVVLVVKLGHRREI